MCCGCDWNVVYLSKLTLFFNKLLSILAYRVRASEEKIDGQTYSDFPPERDRSAVSSQVSSRFVASPAASVEEFKERIPHDNVVKSKHSGDLRTVPDVGDPLPASTSPEFEERKKNAEPSSELHLVSEQASSSTLASSEASVDSWVVVESPRDAGSSDTAITSGDDLPRKLSLVPEPPSHVVDVRPVVLESARSVVLDTSSSSVRDLSTIQSFVDAKPSLDVESVGVSVSAETSPILAVDSADAVSTPTHDVYPLTAASSDENVPQLEHTPHIDNGSSTKDLSPREDLSTNEEGVPPREDLSPEPEVSPTDQVSSLKDESPHETVFALPEDVSVPKDALRASPEGSSPIDDTASLKGFSPSEDTSSVGDTSHLEDFSTASVDRDLDLPPQGNN